jgi:hypothetical protein
MATPVPTHHVVVREGGPPTACGAGPGNDLQMLAHRTNLRGMVQNCALFRQDEADRVIMMYVAPGLSAGIEPEDVIRVDEETEEDYAKRQALMVALCAIPDNA